MSCVRIAMTLALLLSLAAAAQAGEQVTVTLVGGAEDHCHAAA